MFHERCYEKEFGSLPDFVPNEIDDKKLAKVTIEFDSHTWNLVLSNCHINQECRATDGDGVVRLGDKHAVISGWVEDSIISPPSDVKEK